MASNEKRPMAYRSPMWNTDVFTLVDERDRLFKKVAREQRKKMLQPLFGIAHALVASHVKNHVVTRYEVEAYLKHLYDEWNLPCKVDSSFPSIKEEWIKEEYTMPLNVEADTNEWEGDDWYREFISEAGMDESSDSDSDESEDEK